VVHYDRLDELDLELPEGDMVSRRDLERVLQPVDRIIIAPARDDKARLRISLGEC
jgi:hypothetical protein